MSKSWYKAKSNQNKLTIRAYSNSYSELDYIGLAHGHALVGSHFTHFFILSSSQSHTNLSIEAIASFTDCFPTVEGHNTQKMFVPKKH